MAQAGKLFAASTVVIPIIGRTFIVNLANYVKAMPHFDVIIYANYCASALNKRACRLCIKITVFRQSAIKNREAYKVYTKIIPGRVYMLKKSKIRRAAC